MSSKRKCREYSKLLPQFRLYTCILSWAVVSFGLVRFLTFVALKVCYDVDIFQPMKIHVPKIVNLQRCENEITFLFAYIWDTHSNDNRSRTEFIYEIRKCPIVPALAECTYIDPSGLSILLHDVISLPDATSYRPMINSI